MCVLHNVCWLCSSIHVHQVLCEVLAMYCTVHASILVCTMFMCVVYALHLTLCVLCGVVCAGWQSWILPRQRLSNSRGASRQGKSPSLQLDLSSLTRTCESILHQLCSVTPHFNSSTQSSQFGGGWCIVRCSCVHYYAFSEPISLCIPHKTHIHYSERLQQCRIMYMCMLRTIHLLLHIIRTLVWQ